MKLRSGIFFAGVSLVAMVMASLGASKANDSVVKAASDPNGWAIAGHDYGNTRFSPLKQINSENAGKLQLVYSLSKKTKIVSRTPRHHAFFRTIRRGFFIGDHANMKVYPFPERRVLEVEHARWWRSASESLIS